MVTEIICGVVLICLIATAVLYRKNCRGEILKLNAEIDRVLGASAVDEALKEI